MGVYFIAANETKKQWIDPGKIGGGNIKRSFIAGEAANLLTYLMATYNFWSRDHVIIVSDMLDDYSEIKDDYEDVTEKAVIAYNKEFTNSPITYLPEDTD